MSKNIKNLTVILVTIFLAASITSGCIGDAKPVEANNSTVTYTTSNSPFEGNFWMYMYMSHMFDSQRVVYVEQNHYYSTHSSTTTSPKVTDVKPAAKKESFFSKASNSIKSGTKKASSSFKASKTGFKSSGSSYKSSSSFKSSRSGFSSSRSSFRSGRR